LDAGYESLGQLRNNGMIRPRRAHTASPHESDRIVALEFDIAVYARVQPGFFLTNP
jgi:hypothetical protein